MCKVTFKPKYHITSIDGWLNDPNGLIYYKDNYHIFYQSSLLSSDSAKSWGHLITKDFKCYNYLGHAINPDTEYDISGAYSGSAIEFNNKLYLFYTGNVKHKGDFDYINSGRDANILRVESTDGINFTNKKLIMTNKDYPNNLSCHVRDPKISVINNEIYMILGARTKESEAATLIYKTKDLESFQLIQEETYSDLGYMIECPDLFKLGNDIVYSYCPQGVKAEKNRFKNIFSSGYSIGRISKSIYHEWDLGYDFYAPQTFKDNKNRRILIGWAGILGDTDYTYLDNKEGFMHSLTLPRELTLKNGKIYQYPIEEINNRFKKIDSNSSYSGSFYKAYIEEYNNQIDIEINSSMKVLSDGLKFEVIYNKNSAGRKNRCYDIKVKNITIYSDNSIIEMYINNGEYVYTTRIYPEEYNIKINTGISSISVLED